MAHSKPGRFVHTAASGPDEGSGSQTKPRVQTLTRPSGSHASPIGMIGNGMTGTLTGSLSMSQRSTNTISTDATPVSANPAISAWASKNTRPN